MFDNLEDILVHYEEVMAELANPEIAGNQERFRKLMKEQSDLLPLVNTYNDYKLAIKNQNEALSILDTESDEEMREFAKEELTQAKNSAAA